MKNFRMLMAFVFLALILFFSSVYQVSQTENVILLRLGVAEVDASGNPKVIHPGLHFKVPFVTTVVRIDRRLQTLDLDSSRIVTAEQKDVLVDAFVEWKVSNPMNFYTSTGGDFYRAEMLLRQKVLDELRAEFGKETIIELVSGQRAQVMQEIQRSSNEMSKPLGIEVQDVRIKRVDLPNEVLNSVYDRMRSDREKEASLLRAEGKEQALQIRSAADAQVYVILSEARANSAKILAEGTKQAAQIYTDSYQKSPGFFEFYRSLEAYQKSFSSGKNVFVLGSDGAFFKHFMPQGLSN